ncbi:MAG: TIGR02391 family protein [Oxalobacteraceae bacterium]|nr:MAG: TIGR02391 family protein [Oxalobacteraceae bacterium]
MIQFPEAEAMIAMAPEDLAWFILEHAKEQGGLSRSNYTGSWERGAKTREVRKAIAESFAWLEGQQLLVPEPGNGYGTSYYVSRKGQNLSGKDKFDAFRTTSSFPVERLHPKIREKAIPSYLRGDLGPAVLLAFVEVEVAVRSASKIDNQIGVRLMHAAFAKDEGPLTDPLADGGEQTALANLFAGAIGSFKNPHSHRSPTLNNPAETGDLLILASRLLYIVDERVS